MSEWVAPGGTSGERETPRYGELAPAGWTPPSQDPTNPHAPIPPQPGPHPGWTPPPKPGLIPLRPLTLGDVLSATFRVMRRNPRPTLGLALLVQAVAAVLTVVVGGQALTSMLARVAMASAEDRQTIVDGSVLLALIGTIVISLVTGALQGIVDGVVALDVAGDALGERRTARRLWAATRGRRWALIGWTFAVAMGSVLLGAIVVGVVVALAQLGPLGAALGVLAGLFLLLGLLVPFFWLSTKLAFVAALLVVERLPIRAAMRRSWSLTRGSFWRTFGILLLVSAIIVAAGEVLSVPAGLITGLFSGFTNPDQTAEGLQTTMTASAIVSAVIGVLVNAVLAVARAAAPTILYLDSRMRREGLDLELQRWIEERAAGRTPPDPYRRD